MKAALLLPLVLVLASCSRPEANRAAVAPPAIPVQVVTVRFEPLPQLTEVTGTIRPVRRAVIAARLMGAIAELPASLGQSVREGDLLLKLFSADLAARLTQARTQLSMARRDFEREQQLLPKGASTAEGVRTLQDRVTESEAIVRDAEVQLSYTELRAPFDGVIARKLVNAGDLAVPGQPLLEVEGLTDFEVEASIPDSLAAALKPGATVPGETADTSFNGKLREISSMADAATRSVGVKIDVPADAAVRSGQFVRLRLPGPVVRALLVPQSAVSLQGQMERVFVVDLQHTASLRLVRVGRVHGDRVEIVSGLTDNDRVVIAPPAGLREGQPLTLQP